MAVRGIINASAGNDSVARGVKRDSEIIPIRDRVDPFGATLLTSVATSMKSVTRNGNRDSVGMTDSESLMLTCTLSPPSLLHSSRRRTNLLAIPHENGEGTKEGKSST